MHELFDIRRRVERNPAQFFHCTGICDQIGEPRRASGVLPPIRQRKTAELLQIGERIRVLLRGKCDLKQRALSGHIERFEIRERLKGVPVDRDTLAAADNRNLLLTAVPERDIHTEQGKVDGLKADAPHVPVILRCQRSRVFPEYFRERSPQDRVCHRIGILRTILR